MSLIMASYPIVLGAVRAGVWKPSLSIVSSPFITFFPPPFLARGVRGLAASDQPLGYVEAVPPGRSPIVPLTIGLGGWVLARRPRSTGGLGGIR